MKISDTNEAEELFESIGYIKLMTIKEYDYVYVKDGFEISTKEVSGGDNMIEVETVIDNDKFDTIEKIKEILIKEELSLDFSDYFVKKAEVELKKVLSSNL